MPARLAAQGFRGQRQRPPGPRNHLGRELRAQATVCELHQLPEQQVAAPARVADPAGRQQAVTGEGSGLRVVQAGQRRGVLLLPGAGEGMRLPQPVAHGEVVPVVPGEQVRARAHGAGGEERLLLAAPRRQVGGLVVGHQRLAVLVPVLGQQVKPAALRVMEDRAVGTAGGAGRNHRDRVLAVVDAVVADGAEHTAAGMRLVLELTASAAVGIERVVAPGVVDEVAGADGALPGGSPGRPGNRRGDDRTWRARRSASSLASRGGHRHHWTGADRYREPAPGADLACRQRRAWADSRAAAGYGSASMAGGTRRIGAAIGGCRVGDRLERRIRLWRATRANTRTPWSDSASCALAMRHGSRSRLTRQPRIMDNAERGRRTLVALST